MFIHVPTKHLPRAVRREPVLQNGRRSILRGDVEMTRGGLEHKVACPSTAHTSGEAPQALVPDGSRRGLNRPGRPRTLQTRGMLAVARLRWLFPAGSKGRALAGPTCRTVQTKNSNSTYVLERGVPRLRDSQDSLVTGRRDCRRSLPLLHLLSRRTLCLVNSCDSWDTLLLAANLVLHLLAKAAARTNPPGSVHCCLPCPERPRAPE